MKARKYARIKLNKNKWSAKQDLFTLVDIEDLKILSPYTIHSINGYAGISIKNENIPLHRFLMGLGNKLQDPREIDHINENKLDNRRKNL